MHKKKLCAIRPEFESTASGDQIGIVQQAPYLPLHVAWLKGGCAMRRNYYLTTANVGCVTFEDIYVEAVVRAASTVSLT